MSELYEKELADIARRIRDGERMREAILKVIRSCTCEERGCPTCSTLNAALPCEDMLSVRKAEDPVHFVDARSASAQQIAIGWYFWDETWASRFGPYPDRAKAEDMLNAYIRQLNAEEDDRLEKLGLINQEEQCPPK